MGAAFELEQFGYHFSLDTGTGLASLRPGEGAAVWSGTVFPALHVQHLDGQRSVLYASGTERDGSIDLAFGGGAEGNLTLRPTDAGVDIVDLRITLPHDVALVDLFFGLSELEPGQKAGVGEPEYPEWPDWASGAFCVPSARPAPPASFLRRWDLGQATVPLGLYGPALGSPYGAAFPRPVLSAGFGDDRGWLVAGAGEVPDAALTLDVRGTRGALRWRYREDLWPVAERTRHWATPVRFTWAATAVEAFTRYFATFPRATPDATPEAALAAWNSWGDFRREDYRLVELAAAAQDLGAGILVLDAGWETSESTGVADERKFPDLGARLDEVTATGMAIGFWQSVGWIDHPNEVGLTDDDLLVGVDGVPRKTNWAMDPRDSGAHYALDPSSPRTREFLVERTRAIMRTYRPSLLKLDFGYGLPGPDAATPRDPSLRGERLGHELYRIVRDAAKAEDPAVAIQLYGVHPLHAALADVIALDDMGDHGDHAEAEGHRHWSVWAAALGSHGVVVNGSSGYRWDQDDQVVLDTVVLGTPGAVLPLLDPQQPPTARWLARRRAINRWHRRTVHWTPRWLDSELGGVDVQPSVRSWGRLEEGRLAALCLRAESAGLLDVGETSGIDHTGEWGVVAIGADELGSGAFAALPIAAGTLRVPLAAVPGRVERWVAGVASTESGQIEAGHLILSTSDAELDAGLEGWVITP